MNGFERYTKKTRREAFLEEMEQVVPWRELCALIEPHYPTPVRRLRGPSFRRPRERIGDPQISPTRQNF